MQKEQWMSIVLIFNFTTSIDYGFCDDEGRCGIFLTALGAVEKVISLEQENECETAF